MLTCSSSCWTTCIWTRHCAVLLSSSVCSLFKCLRRNTTCRRQDRSPRNCLPDITFGKSACSAPGARSRSRIGGRSRRTGMDLTPAPQFRHSLEKCLKVSEDGLAAGPLAHSVSIQGMAALRALVQRTTGGEMRESQTETQKRKDKQKRINGVVTFLSSSAGGAARWRWTADWKTLWGLRWLTCYRSHSLKIKASEEVTVGSCASMWM